MREARREARGAGSREDSDDYAPLPSHSAQIRGAGAHHPRLWDWGAPGGVGGPITLVMGAGLGEPWAGAGGLADGSCRVQSCCISYASDFHAKIRWSMTWTTGGVRWFIGEA